MTPTRTPHSEKGPLVKDREEYVELARKVELMALELAKEGVEPALAVDALVEAAEGNVLVMRRAHRHCEHAVGEQWPAGPSLIRAFDYLSVGRRELELSLAGVRTSPI